MKEGLQDTIKGKISLNIKVKVGDPILGITNKVAAHYSGIQFTFI